MQTFYYTLINFLNLSSSKHILEIACGTGKLLPLAMRLKNENTTYLGTDLAENMIKEAHLTLEKELKKMGVEANLEDWMKKQRLELRTANGEEHIQSDYKFDRIICNLVLMIVEDPIKMMKNLHSLSEEGCLLGVTIWGNK